MKVLQLGKAYPPANLGGVEVTIQLLSEGLNASGIDCDALGVNDTYEFKIETGASGGKIYRAKLIRKAFSTLLSTNLISVLQSIKDRYDIIHVHSPDPMSALALFITRPKSKVVLHWHSDILKQKFLLYFYNPILKWLLRRANLILATSPNYIEGSPYLSAHSHKTKVLPIGIDVDTNQFVDAEDPKFADFDGKKIIFSLGRLAYYKGYQHLILAARQLPEDFVVVIAGEGDQRQYLEQLIAEHSVKNVKLVGNVTEHAKTWFLSKCALFVLPSIFKTEAFAIVQVEAMAFGKPIVSTNIPGSGVSWVNQHNVTGLVVPIEDSTALAVAIQTIMFDQELYKRLSDGCLLRYQQVFKRQLMIDTLIGYYLDVTTG